MSSFIILELDTTPPILTIQCPNYAVFGQNIEIFIYANEELSTYQDIYITDSNNNRYNLIFQHKGNYFYGIVNFTGLNSDIYTLHARLCDTVENISGVISHSIKVSRYKNINVTIEDLDRGVSIKDKGLYINIIDTSRGINTKESKFNVSVIDTDRSININEKSRITQITDTNYITIITEKDR